MADSNFVAEGIKRGYSLDEIADIVLKDKGADPAEIRNRGYSAPEILGKFGYAMPTKPAESGIFGTLGGGAAQTWRTLGGAVDLAQGDTPELQAAAAAQAARVKDPRLTAFEADLAQRRERLGKDPGWLDVIGEVGSAAWKNPAGAGLMAVDQLPNSAAVMAGGGAGALAGSALGPAGTAVGGVIGGIAGMYAGNLAVEGGNRALEHVGKTGGLADADRSRLIYESAIKAGVITGVDAATFSMTKFVTNAGRRAVETATLRVAEQAGVKATEIAARRAADPAFDAAITSAQKLAMEGASTFGKRAMQTGAALGLETVGEGLGEYLGEFAATGEADKMDAVIEAFSSLGQSAAEIGIAKAWNSHTPTVDDISKATTGDEAIAAADAALAAPVEALAPNVDEWKARTDDTLYVAPTGDVMSDDQLPAYDLYQQATIPARNAPLLATATQEAQDRLATAQTDEGTTGIEARRPKTILKRPAEDIDTAELRAILTSPETSAVTARAIHAELAARERAATPTAEGTGATNEIRATMGGTTVTVPAAAPAKTNTVAEAVAILRTPVEQRVPADAVRLRNVADRIGPEAMGRIEQFVKGPALLTRDEQVATERLIASDARTAPAPAATPATLSQPATQQQLADNEAGLFSQPRKSVFRNSQLRSESGPDIKGERVTRNMRKALVMMGRITGTKVIFEYAPEDSDGAVPNRAENTIHINTAAQINPMQVMGHEVTHVLRDRHAKAWTAVRNTLVATMSDKRKALDVFAADYWGGNAENLKKLEAARAMPDWSAQLTPEQKTQFGTSENTIEAFMLDEMVSDLGGQHWSSEKFWIDVFAKIEAQEGAKAKGIIERLVMSIKAMLGKFLDVVRAQGQGDYGTVSPEQIEATRDAITNAYAEFIRAERRTEPDGEPHVTDNRIRTSNTHSRSSGGEGEPQQPATTPAPQLDDLDAARADELAALSPARIKRDQRLFFEVAPKPSEAGEWNKRSDKEQRAVSEDIKSRVIPGLLRDIGVTGNIQPQLGGWMDDTNPSFALVVTGGDPAVAARAVGYVLDQEAVYALGLKPFTGGEKTGIIHFNIDSSDRALVHKIYTQIRALDSDAISGHSTLDGEMYIGLPVERMDQLKQQVLTVLGNADIADAYFDEGYGATIGEANYDMQGTQGASPELRAQARDVNQWRDEARKLRGKSDAGSGGSDRAISRSEKRPSYGKAIDQHAGTVTGVHYSNAKREELSSEFYGTGYRGAERARLAGATDPRIKRRVYFYINKGGGITPETGVGYHAHSVDLSNMYDGDTDALGLWGGADANKFESNVIDAGYDGYYTRNFGKNGAAVLLGAHTVPVAYEGLGARPDVPALLSTPRPAKWWYSPLVRAAGDAQMKNAPATGWLDWLKSLPAKGVKPDEIKWSGIEEWLDTYGKQTVTRKQVQAYLSEFGVKIETILRGESSSITDTTQDVDAEDVDIELNDHGWNTDEPDEDYLTDRAGDRLDEEIDYRVENSWDDIADGIDRNARIRIEVNLPDIAADVRRQMGDMFPVDDELVEQVARSYAAAQVAGDTWQEYADNDVDLSDEAVQAEATERAFAVLSGDTEALETEARRRARAAIDDDSLLDELAEREREWYYDDSESPQTREITVEGVDGTFYHSMSYGEHRLSYDGREITLPRRADEAYVDATIREYVMDNGLVAGSSGGDFRSVKWDDYATDKNRAVAGSYREVQLTLPIGAFGQPRSKSYAGVEYNYYDNDNMLIGATMSEDVAKRKAEELGGRYERYEAHVETERANANDFYYTTHWQEANVVGHARWDEHRDADNKRVLVLQEVQGDWGQQRREGLEAQEKLEAARAALNDAVARYDDAINAVEATGVSDSWRESDWREVARSRDKIDWDTLSAVQTEAVSELQAAWAAKSNADIAVNRAEDNARNIPSAAPFIEKTVQWAGLVLKRMIAHAVENGFDKVVWTSGAQQVERWRSSLRKQVDTIAWEKTPEGIHITASQNGRTRTDTRVSETALSDAIGKQMAKQIIADPNQSGEITGNNITISDTGMAGFYDRMLPNIANDILKKLDKTVRVKEIEVHEATQVEVRKVTPDGDKWTVGRSGYEPHFNTREEAEARAEKIRDENAATSITTQLGFEITPAMHASAAAGLPLFSERRRAAADRKADNRRAWYYSQLSAAVNDIPSKLRTGKEAALWLTSNASKLGIKKEELQWSGVTDWLQSQPTPSGVSDWLRNNGVRVKDVMLGDESDEYRRLDAELQEQDALVAAARRKAANLAPHTRGIIPIDEIRAAANEGNDVQPRQLQAMGFDERQIEALLEYGRALNRKNELFEQRKAAMGEQPKFGRDDLVLPGSTPGSYRELLLTLPDARKPAPDQMEPPKVVDRGHDDDGRARFDVVADDGQILDTFNTWSDARGYAYDYAQDENIRRNLAWQKSQPAQFTSSHYKQPNIVVHLRFNERTDANGKRVMFLEEVQSDWGQKGRKEGFVSDGKLPSGWTVEQIRVSKYSDAMEWAVFDNSKTQVGLYGKTKEEAIASALNPKGFTGGTPSAPFVTDTKSWVALALKRAIAYAVDNGFDAISWTTGEQQNERYDLSKQVSSIRYNKVGGEYGIVAIGKTDSTIVIERTVPESGLEEIVGKDIAKKIIAGEGTPGKTELNNGDVIDTKSFSGLDLKVGGNGMRGFYGLPDPTAPIGKDKTGKDLFPIMTVVARQLGAKVGEVDGQPSFDITDAMREQAAVGMPLFSQRRATPALDRWLGKSKVRTVMYHGTARDISTFRPQQADAIFLTDDPEFAGNFADLSHSWMVNNYQTWMTDEQIQSARRDAMRMLLQDALPGSSLYNREERMLNQSQPSGQYMRRAVEQYMPSESNIMPLYVRAENPFDYRNPAHTAAIEREIGPSWMGHEFINGEMFEVAQHIGDLERGDWNAIESPQVQAYIRQRHDSFYVRERGVTNLAVFSPNQVKSASGNTGAYSREDDDIRRSELRPNTENLDTAMRRMDKFVTAFEAKQVKASDTQLLGPTPTVLQALGAKPLDMLIDGHTIHKILVDPLKHKDYMTAAMLRDLPRGLYDPLMVFDSPNPKTGKPGKLFVTELDDELGNPVIGAVHMNKQGPRMVINEIASYYGLDNFMTRDKTSPSRLEYIRSDEALALSTTLRSLNLSLVVQKARELDRNIQTEQDIVNQYGDKYSTPRSRMSGQPINQSWTDPDVTDWDDLVRKLQDDKIDTKRVLRAIRDAGVLVKEKFDAYMLETNYHGRAAARVDAFADGELRKLLEDMSMRKLSMTDLDDYLWARHAPERNTRNARSNPAITDGSGMSDAQSAAILAGQAVTLNGRTIQLSAAALRAATAVSARVDAITKGTLDLLVSSGLETQATVDTWRNTYKHYAPLKRDMESDSNYSGAFGLGNGTGSGFSVRGAASKRALGSKRAVTDVLANIAMQREVAITRAEKNRVAQAVYGLALSAPNPEFWIPVNPELNKRLSPVALAKAVAELVAIGVNPLDAQSLATEPVQRYTDPKTGLEMQRINPQLRGRNDVLSTRINGEDRYVFFSNKKRAQEMVRGLKNLDAATISGALQVIAPVTRWFASVNTQFNPVFGLTNGVRDFGTGMLNLSSTPLSADRVKIAGYAWDALKGIYLDLRDHRAGRAPRSQWAQLFEQFELDGGRTGYRDMFATSADRAEAIAKELEHAGKGKQWLLGGEKHSAVFGWLSDYNTAVENAMRLAAYKAALDRGMSRDSAASLAKNLTVNFNKKGLAATQTGALYAFFNASVQGTARIAETVSKDGKLTDVGQKIIYGGMMVGVMQALMGALAGWDDDEPPQFQREKNFIIPIFGTDKYASIPMPLGFHVLPNIGRVTTEWMMSGFKDPGKRLVSLAGTILNSFNPIGNGTIAQTLSPTIGDPVIALAENEDWNGKSIYKADFNKLHPTAGWTRTKDTASPPSKWLSYGINYITGGGKYGIGMASPTPDQIDYLVGQATGGVGRELLKTAQYINSKVTGEELPIHKTPLGVGRFVGETKGQSSETSKFYRNLERIGEHKSALEEMKDARDGEAIRAYLVEHPEARLVQTADKAQREIGYLRRQKREVIEKGGNPERVKMLEEKITATTRRYNEYFRQK